jgi:hypothetical protein
MPNFATFAEFSLSLLLGHSNSCPLTDSISVGLPISTVSFIKVWPAFIVNMMMLKYSQWDIQTIDTPRQCGTKFLLHQHAKSWWEKADSHAPQSIRS